MLNTDFYNCYRIAFRKTNKEYSTGNNQMNGAQNEVIGKKK